MQADIDALSSYRSLTPIASPPYYQEFVVALEKIDMHYWADMYQQHVDDNLDKEALGRRLSIPEHVLKSGARAIDNFLQGETKRTAEARMVLLGGGGVGKTSLVNRFFGEPVNPKEKSTPKVEIRALDHQVAGKTLRVHYWDFGGQVFLHAAHQLFLRDKCVYVIMIQARETNEPELISYWLEHVRVYGDGSPTIIVQNQVDELHTGMKTAMPFDRNVIQQRYPFVVGFYNISCQWDDTGNAEQRQNSGIKLLQKAIDEQLSANKILDEPTPQTWFDLKTKLNERLHDNNAIDQQTFTQLCTEVGLSNIDDRDAALQGMDQLGVALHYAEIDKDWYILNPSWLAEVIYYLLNSSGEQGYNMLDKETLEKIFDNRINPQAPSVPHRRLDSILKLLVHFGLAYEAPKQKGRYFVPMLAAELTPENFTLPQGEFIGVQTLLYRFLPPNLFPSLMVLCGAEIVGEMMWRDVCVLQWGGARAVMQCDKQEKSISIQIWGEPAARCAYLQRLTERLLIFVNDEQFSNLPSQTYFAINNNRYGLETLFQAVQNKSEYVFEHISKRLDSVEQITQTLLGKEEIFNKWMMSIIENFSKGNPSLYQYFHQTQNNQQNTAVNVNVNQQMRTSIALQGDLDDLMFDIEQAIKKQSLSDEDSQKIDSIKDHIKHLQQQIEEHKQLGKQSDAEAQAKQKNLWQRIGKRTKTLVELIKDVSYLTTLVEQVEDLLSCF